MYSIYINHFKRDNSIIDTEELMFAVPIVNNAFINKPVVKSSEDSADSFSFSMESNSPYYDAILPYKTTIRVEYDGDVVFWGRTLAPSTSSVLHTKTINCEGSYVYFNDTYYEGVQEKYRTKITVSDYLTKVLNNHNNMTPAKQIFRGDVGVTLPSITEKYEPTSWTQTSSILSELTGNNGGHMRVRYTNGNAYLDWYKYYIRDLGDGLRPSVTVGKNILDITSDANNRNVFTRVIPIGTTDHDGKSIYIDGYKYRDKDNVEHTYSGKAMPVSFVRNLYTSAQLTDEFHNWTDYRDAEANYGIIYKTMSFGDADTQEKLFNEVKKWIKECYFSIASSFTVKAIDFHIIDGNVPKILLGDCVDVTFLIVINGIKQWVTKKLVCKALQYDLYNPENNSYTFGIPSDLLKDPSRKKSSKKTLSNAVGGNKVTPKGDEDEDITWRKVWHMIGNRQGDPEYEGTNAALSFYENGEITGSVLCYDPDDIPDSDPPAHLNLWFNAQNIGKITLSGYPTRFVAISADRGIFAYEGRLNGPRVMHWYDKHKGYKYEGAGSGISTFEEIAKMIEKDSSTNYGGSEKATEFRNNGRISGSVKCYDPSKTDSPSTHPEYVFQAQLVGKFSSLSTIIYVASAVQYGIFAYPHNGEIEQIQHWYQRSAGNEYDNVSQLITEEKTESTFATDDGTPDGNKTLQFSPKELSFPDYSSEKTYTVGSMVTHEGYIYKCKSTISTPEEWNAAHWDQQGSASKGQALIGFDVTSGSGDKWKIKLNTPVQYTDADGNVKVADGFVSASDFAVQEIPSFKTKIGIFDIVVAGKVEAQTISADLAEVRKWLGDTITAGTLIRTETLRAQNVSAENHFEGASFVFRGRNLQNELECCFNDASITSSNGQISLTLRRIASNELDHSDPTRFASKTINFNIAETQFFIDQINSVYGAGYSATISPGSSTTVTLKYDDPQTGITRNTGHSYTISASPASIDRFTGVEIEDDYEEHSPGYVDAVGTGVNTKRCTLYLTVGTWHDAGSHGFNRDYIACNIRVGSSSGTLIARRWITARYADTSGNE